MLLLPAFFLAKLFIFCILLFCFTALFYLGSISSFQSSEASLGLFGTALVFYWCAKRTSMALPIALTKSGLSVSSCRTFHSPCWKVMKIEFPPGNRTDQPGSLSFSDSYASCSKMILVSGSFTLIFMVELVLGKGCQRAWIDNGARITGINVLRGWPEKPVTERLYHLPFFGCNCPLSGCQKNHGYGVPWPACPIVQFYISSLTLVL